MDQPDIQKLLTAHTHSQKALVSGIKNLKKQLRDQDKKYKAELSRLEKENKTLIATNKKLTETIRAKLFSQINYMQKLLKLDRPDETTSLQTIYDALLLYCSAKKLLTGSVEFEDSDDSHASNDVDDDDTNVSSTIVKLNKPLQKLLPIDLVRKHKKLPLVSLAQHFLEILRSDEINQDTTDLAQNACHGAEKDTVEDSDSSSDGMNSLDLNVTLT